MSWPLLTVREQTSISQAAELLAKYRFTALPVVDEDGFLVGIVSEADLIGDPTEGRSTVPSTVGGVMTRDVVCMFPETDLKRLTHWLLKLDLRVMPITDHHRRLVGVVTRMDLMRREHLPTTGLDWLTHRAKRLFGGGPRRASRSRPVPLYSAPAPPPPTRSPGHALRAGDIMSTNPVRVRETTTVNEAIELMEKYRFTALPVVDTEEHLVGIISSADLLHDPGEDTILYPRHRPTVAPRHVGGVMTADVIFRWPDSDLRELSHWLLTMGRRVMPIVDADHRLVGVVTRGDLMRVRDELNLHQDG